MKWPVVTLARLCQIETGRTPSRANPEYFGGKNVWLTIAALNDTIGRFREDLFHRIAVGVLHLPPLRDRHGDIDMVIDHILEHINRKFEDKPAWRHKKLSAGARNLMHHHPWPGNVRELYNTLSRAAILIAGETIEIDDMREALFPVTRAGHNGDNVLNRALGNGFSLPDVLSDVARHYLKKAVAESKGNKTKMASLVGLPNYQTLSNWLKKYGIEE